MLQLLIKIDESGIKSKVIILNKPELKIAIVTPTKIKVTVEVI